MVHRTMTIDDACFVIASSELFERLKLDVVTAVTLGGGLVELPTGIGMLSRTLLVTPHQRIEFIERDGDDDPAAHDDAFPEM